MSVAAVRIVDTIGQDLSHLRNLPYWQERPVASYTTRSFAASDEQFGWFPHAVRVDQAPTNALARGARVKDVENGGATNANAAALAAAGDHFVAYTFLDNLPALRAAVARSGRAQNVRYWLADWNLSEAGALAYLGAHSDVVAVQWCSPTTNGRLVVPGSSSTVAELNVDLSVGVASFWLPPAPKPEPREPAGVWRFKGAVHMNGTERGKWEIEGLPGENVVMGEHARKWAAKLAVSEQHGVWEIEGEPYEEVK